MITDAVAMTDIQRDWEGVGQLKEKIKRHMFVAGPDGGALFLADCAHNLPFLQACSVLNDVLEQLRDEGHFRCSHRTLGALVKTAAAALPWIDHAAVLVVVDARNGLAHKTVVLNRADCWRHIATVEAELRNWKIIS
jgi:hypothetical protein